jgi:hypothetical protein
MFNIAMLCCMLASQLTALHRTTLQSNTLQSAKLLAGMQAGAVLADAITTRNNVVRGYVEGDPLTRPLIGVRPTYASMIPLGAAEVGLAYLLARKYPRMRWLQVSFTVTHAACALRNSTLK